MKKKKLLFVNLVIIIAIVACANFSDFVKDTKAQPSESPTIAIMEEKSQPTIPLTETPQLTDKPNPYVQIQTNLISEPPCGGNKMIRKDVILELDEYLKDESIIWDPELLAFYDIMIDRVASEINEPVLSGVRIWSMYNHGFIVKTPSSIFAFDLVHGYSGWDYQLPDAILEQIQVLFITHRHGDHQEYSITRGIVDLGGEVVKPIEDKSVAFDIVYLSPDEEVTVAGLHVKAYDGLHGNLANRIYMVTTPEGLTVMHTGDNQTSETLPDEVTPDILLLNAWVNESGSASATIGMSNSMKKLNPKLTILGHIHELGHAYDPSSIYSRLSFEPPLAVSEMDLPGEVIVQIWGEHCDFPTE
jgi:L-ascorbate metabolism protein UlaG (beta-lactamase superfamily)